MVETILATYALPAIVTFVVVQAVKAVTNKFTAIVAFVLGIVFVSIFDGGISANSVLNGILVGAAASGLYSWTPSGVKDKINVLSK